MPANETTSLLHVLKHFVRVSVSGTRCKLSVTTCGRIYSTSGSSAVPVPRILRKQSSESKNIHKFWSKYSKSDAHNTQVWKRLNEQVLMY
jgi:hypothetical protein